MTGNVVMFNPDRGFGFIANPHHPNVFFHVSDIVAGLKASDPVDVGTLLEFEVVKMPKGPRAVKIQVIDTETEQAAHAG
jgi:cold shock CspA family protein